MRSGDLQYWLGVQSDRYGTHRNNFCKKRTQESQPEKAHRSSLEINSVHCYVGYRALVYGDLQATDGHERMFSSPGSSLQIWRVRKTYTDLWKMFKAYKCDCLWDLGDTTDDRSFLPMPAIDVVMEGLEPFPKHELNIKLIGNHEKYYRDSALDVGRMFASKFNVVRDTDVVEVDDTLIVSAAYPASDSALADWLSHTAYGYRNYRRRLLLGHFQVVGCQMNSGQAIMGVPLEVVEKYSLVLLGHVHRPQKMGRNCHYVGSPFQQNYGEKYEVKRVGVVDIETLNVEWVPMDGYPVYRIVSYADWARLVRKDNEDRYQVILASNEEAECYYKHPLMGQAEPIYDFSLSEEQKAEAAQQQHWSQADMMTRWMKQHKPSTLNIQATEEEVLEAGRFIANG